MEGSRLSSWKAMLSKFQTKKSKLTKEISQLTKVLTSLNKKIKDIERKIEDLNQQEICICQHALDRYRTRFNPDATDKEIYQELITEELKEITSVVGNTEYTANGRTVIIKDRTLVTIY